jgi:VTC domain-containing protein
LVRQETFSNILADVKLEKLPLEKATKVRLMNRVDKKYWFRVSELPALFQAIKEDYYIQTIDGRGWQQYATRYFDTTDNKMYTLHHNGKLNRYKIRRRDYLDTEDQFLEVKFKNNQGRTIKKRVASTVTAADFNENESAFINERSIFNHDELHVALQNKFTRLTLISKALKERCTVDIDLSFIGNSRSVDMTDLVILELKSEKGNSYSPLKAYLREARLKPSGFSKYCIGRALTDTTIKRNVFKQKIRDIGKMLDMPDLYNM